MIKPRMTYDRHTKLWYCEQTFGFTKVCEAGLTPERAFRNYQRKLRRTNIPSNYLKGNA